MDSSNLSAKQVVAEAVFPAAQRCCSNSANWKWAGWAMPTKSREPALDHAAAQWSCESLSQRGGYEMGTNNNAGCGIL